MAHAGPVTAAPWLVMLFVAGMVMPGVLIPGAANARPAGFQILVDTNQLLPDEAMQASRFTADGVWSIPENSPAGIDWSGTLTALNGARWSVSEDNPQQTSQVDRVSAAMHRPVDGAMFYNEDGMATPLSDRQIDDYAAHVIPGQGAVGRRVIVLTRSFGSADPRQAQLKHALANPNVSGATFEFNPGTIESTINVSAGCAYIVHLHKSCYLLVPPRAGSADYVGDLQRSIDYFSTSEGLLGDPSVFIVVAAYVRPGAVHYLSSSDADRNSVEAAVRWLKAYRADPLHPPR